jgi:precorrin-2 dehydrogenase/sirohydrochlorin ferrochelatase
VVIAATDDQEVNTRVTSEAKELGVLVNVVDDAKKSNFIVPSCLHRGDINIAISTSGRSPALARRLRRKLEEEIGEEYTFLALIVNEVREELKRRGIKVSRNAWQKALDLDKLIELIKRGEIGAATSAVLDYLLEQQTKIAAASKIPVAFKMPRRIKECASVWSESTTKRLQWPFEKKWRSAMVNWTKPYWL